MKPLNLGHTSTLRLKNIQQLVFLVIRLILENLNAFTYLAMDQIAVDRVSHVLAHEIVLLVHRYLFDFLQLAKSQ